MKFNFGDFGIALMLIGVGVFIGKYEAQNELKPYEVKVYGVAGSDTTTFQFVSPVDPVVFSSSDTTSGHIYSGSFSSISNDFYPLAYYIKTIKNN